MKREREREREGGRSSARDFIAAYIRTYSYGGIPQCHSRNAVTLEKGDAGTLVSPTETSHATVSASASYDGRVHRLRRLRTYMGHIIIRLFIRTESAGATGRGECPASDRSKLLCLRSTNTHTRSHIIARSKD